MDHGSAAVGSNNRMVDGISDPRFAAQVKALQQLKQFLFDEKVAVQAEALEATDLGSLNNIKYALNGRPPTESEWKALDQKLAVLAPLLTPAMRWKLRIRELRFFFVTVPIISMGTSVIATFFLILLMSVGEERAMIWFLIAYSTMLLIWTISQGTLGACAFLCISATTHALRERASSDSLSPMIDVTNENILGIRVILGALFSLLALPIGGRSVAVIYSAFSEEHPIPPIQDWIIVLLPFMFGFSTTLVLTIFNKIVGGISAIFGISSETAARD